MIAAKSFETFAEAILMKLIIEIADLPPQRRPQHAGANIGLRTASGK